MRIKNAGTINGSHIVFLFSSPSLDSTILIVGINQSIKVDGSDRVNIQIPGQQPHLITKVSNTSKGNVILVIMSRGRFNISFAKNDDKITSILWVRYLGLSFKVCSILDL